MLEPALRLGSFSQFISFNLSSKDTHDRIFDWLLCFTQISHLFLKKLEGYFLRTILNQLKEIALLLSDDRSIEMHSIMTFTKLRRERYNCDSS